MRAMPRTIAVILAVASALVTPPRRKTTTLAARAKTRTPYDFTYCNVDFLADTTVIGVAAGSGTMLPITTKLPLRVEVTSADGNMSTNNAESSALVHGTAPWLDAARAYFGLATRLQFRQTGMAGGALARAAEEDFVNARQADKNITPEDLGRWLTCARLIAASALSETVEMAHYQEARRMDNERRERLQAREVAM